MSENNTMMERIIDQAHWLIDKLDPVEVVRMDTNFHTETIDIEFRVNPEGKGNITAMSAKVFVLDDKPTYVITTKIRGQDE